MPEEATRKLLNLFGITLTVFEDHTRNSLEGTQALGSGPQVPAVTLALAGCG